MDTVISPQPAAAAQHAAAAHPVAAAYPAAAAQHAAAPPDSAAPPSSLSAAAAAAAKSASPNRRIIKRSLPDEPSRLTAPDYSQCPSGLLEHALALLIGFAAGFAVSFTFYKLVILSLTCGALFGIVNVFTAAQSAVSRRMTRLRVQFFDLLESLSVAMRAGSPLYRALQSAREDLLLLYTDNSDIITEVDMIIAKFNNAVPLSDAFTDFAERAKLEDLASFASVYATIEGKSGRTDEIIRETQQIISDKMEIEMEIATLLSAAKSEANIMLFMPVLIIGVIGYSGAGFMDSIYTTTTGRIVSTIGLIVYVISYVLARKFSNVVL